MPLMTQVFYHEERHRLDSIVEVDEKRFSYNDLSEGNQADKSNDLSITLKDLQIEDDSGPEIKILTGAYKIGKVPTQCEDAYFICDRGFGVSDGVSGWNDYGFSSSAFSNQLMDNCLTEIEGYMSQQKECQ